MAARPVPLPHPSPSADAPAAGGLSRSRALGGGERRRRTVDPVSRGTTDSRRTGGELRVSPWSDSYMSKMELVRCR